nr:MAG TPA: hypothetical protein [Caudoviricetes sp.]
MLFCYLLQNTSLKLLLQIVCHQFVPTCHQVIFPYNAVISRLVPRIPLSPTFFACIYKRYVF